MHVKTRKCHAYKGNDIKRKGVAFFAKTWTVFFQALIMKRPAWQVGAIQVTNNHATQSGKDGAIPNAEKGAKAFKFFIKQRGSRSTKATMSKHCGMFKQMSKPSNMNCSDCDKMAELANNPMGGSSVVAMATKIPPRELAFRSQTFPIRCRQ